MVILDGLFLCVISKIYMYDFDLVIGVKIVLGKFLYEGDIFFDGDIVYLSDFNVLYVLIGKVFYILDMGSFELI